MFSVIGTDFNHFIYKNSFMKTHISGKQNPSHPQTKSAKRPENKDSPDSREGEEQSDKGNDVTHNKKDKHGELKHKNKK